MNWRKIVIGGLIFLVSTTGLVACIGAESEDIVDANGWTGGMVFSTAEEYCGPDNIGKEPNPDLWYYSVSVDEKFRNDRQEHRFEVVALQYDGLDFSCRSDWMPVPAPTATALPTQTPEPDPFLVSLAHPTLPDNQSGAYVANLQGIGTVGISEKDLFDIVSNSDPFDRLSFYRVPTAEAGNYSGLEAGVLHVFDNPTAEAVSPNATSQYELLTGSFNTAGPFVAGDGHTHWTFYTSDGRQVAVQYSGSASTDWVNNNGTNASNPIILVGKYDPRSSADNPVFEIEGILVESSSPISYRQQSGKKGLASLIDEVGAMPAGTVFGQILPDEKEINDAQLAKLRQGRNPTYASVSAKANPGYSTKPIRQNIGRF